MKAITTITATTLALLLFVPSAAAHATYSTDDGRYLVIIGYKGEPVYTYQTTGLDLIIRENATGAPGEGAHETLDAVLLSPSGKTLIGVLEPQHGQTNRYQFTEGFVLTETGFYSLRLSGEINGSAIDGTFQMAHATKSNTEIMFPDQGLQTPTEQQAEIAALRAANAALSDRLEALESESEDSPMPGLPLLLAVLAVALVALRRRR